MKVIMVGPGNSPPGGILALVDTIVPKLEKEVTLVYFPTSKKFRYFHDTGKITLSNIVIVINQYLRFIKEIIVEKPNLAHIHTSDGLGWLKDTILVLIAKLFGLKVILHVHAASFEQFYSGRSFIEKTIFKEVLQRVDLVIALSDKWLQEIIGINPDIKAIVLRNCVDTSSYPPREYKSNNGDKPTAIFIGSIGKRKGVWDLLEAVHRIKQDQIELNVQLAGSPDDYGAIQTANKLVESLDLKDRCAILGPITGDIKENFLNNASIMVLPSYNEGLPMSLIEGLATGLPIISTPVGGIPELIMDGKNGYLIEPGNIPELVNRLEYLATHPETCRQMGRLSREMAEEQYDVIPYVKKLIELYETVLG